MNYELIKKRAKRLAEIAKAIASGDRSELTMRVPADPERDADLVCSSSAQSLRLLLDVARAADDELAMAGDDEYVELRDALTALKEHCDE